MRAAIYTRVSADARGDARSVQEQEKECRDWVAREGWTLEGVWTDNDLSASKYGRKQRPSWRALLDRIDQGELDIIVVWEPSRATRDRAVWAALAATCEERNVKFGYGGRVYDLSDPDDAFQLDLFFALASRESGALQNLEHENRIASIEHLNRIARLLGVPLMAISREITITSKPVPQHGPAIRALREKEGLSVQDLANLMSISYGHLQNIEHENKPASQEHIDSLLYFLGVKDPNAVSRAPLAKHSQAAA